MSSSPKPIASYDPSTGVLAMWSNKKWHPMVIQYSDTEVNQLPTIVKPAYINMIKQQSLKILDKFYGLGSIVDLEVAQSTMTLTTEVGPDVQLSIAQLAEAINQDPVHSTKLQRLLIDELVAIGYQIS
jgi:hypothetical protein